jgi:hypothetical protein
MDKLTMARADNLRIYLARFRRRLRLRNGWLLAQRTLWLALAVAAGVQLFGRLWPLERLGLWTLIPLAGWLVAVLGASLLKPLPPLRVARRVDAELDLKERLSTAVVFNLSTFQRSNLSTFQHSNLFTLQRQDALAIARAVQPRRAFPLRWLRRPLLVAAVFAVAAVALALLPNPMDAVLEERAAIARAAEQEAQAIEKLRQEVEQAQELSPEEREALLRQLAELAEQLRANPGDREEALADLSRVEEALREKIDPNVDARRAALEALSRQLQALTGQEDAEEALEKLAEELAQMDTAEREALARSLAQMAAHAAQSGDPSLAQALAQMAQAAQTGDDDADAASQAAQSAAEAMARAQGELADQEALQQVLGQLQASRQAVAGAGQSQMAAEGSGQGEGQGQGQGDGEGQGQGQGQGQPGGGGGTQADTLPPARRSGRPGDPRGEGEPGAVGELDDQVYVPWERRPGSSDQVSITGPEAGEGETQVRERQNPLPGAPGEALVPYHQVYYDYLDAAHRIMERSAIPSGLRDYVRDYFSQLEP